MTRFGIRTTKEAREKTFTSFQIGFKETTNTFNLGSGFLTVGLATEKIVVRSQFVASEKKIFQMVTVSTIACMHADHT